MSSGTSPCWCYQCSCPVQLHYGVCPHCHSGFVQELDHSISEAPGITVTPANHGDYFEGSNSEIFFEDVATNDSMVTSGNDGDYFEGSNPEILFQDVAANDSMVTLGNDGDYFEGPNPEVLFEDVATTDIKGPPPASLSSINALPSIKITQKHLRTQPECAICQESFKVGTKVKQMPCNHMFDADCITTWLVQHNTCPVCREELPPEGSSSNDGSTGHGSGSNNRRGPRQHDRRRYRRPLWALC